MKKNGIQTLVLVLFAALAAALLCACSGEERPAAAEESATLINLNGSGAEIQGVGAAANGNIISIRAGGVYFVSGKLENGQIIIDTGEAPAEVSLVLGGAEINCANDAAIYLRQAEKLRIRLEAGSENSIRSGREADMDSWDESRTGSALYAEDDVDIEGEGTLSILGLLNSGLICKDDLEIKGGNITVLAANNGLRGSESVEIKGGTISVTAGNDGIKSTSAKKEGKGYIRLSGGTVAVCAGGDGFSAETDLLIEGGSLFVSAEKDGLQAGPANSGLGRIDISGGTSHINAGKRAINARGTWLVSGGSIFALCTEEQAGPERGGQPFLLASMESDAGDKLSVLSTGTVLADAAADFPTNYVFYSSPELVSAGEYCLSNGKNEILSTAY